VVMGPQATVQAAAEDSTCPAVQVVFARATFEAGTFGDGAARLHQAEVVEGPKSAPRHRNHVDIAGIDTDGASCDDEAKYHVRAVLPLRTSFELTDVNPIDFVDIRHYP